MANFDFENLFIFEMANNHQGEVEHGVNIIRSMGDLAKKFDVKSGVKFQFRHLDTFIHPDFRNRKDVKHIDRFLSTELTQNQFQTLINETRNQGLVTICTPFDEVSVDRIVEMEIQVVKIASCSATDRPLIEKIAKTGKPVVLSTAGVSLEKLDKIVSYLEYKGIHFALMHCKAIYPTPKNALNLNTIEIFKNRYPNAVIGYSTHEDPNNFDAVRVAYAKGARVFEKHVGVETNEHKLNSYSASPLQLERWLEAYKDTVDMCGGEGHAPAAVVEMDSLQSLMRGVFARRAIKKGERLTQADVFFAMPVQKGQLTSSVWLDGLVADRDYEKNQSVDETLAAHETTAQERIFSIMLQVKAMLSNARVPVGKESSIEVSHHYGLERFREFGCVIITCINRTYCKKVIVQLPRQKHPYHYHKQKEESFQLLYGDLEIEVNGFKSKLTPSDVYHVKPTEWHKFHTLDGAIVEEVSTTHYNNDSVYEDEKIASLPREARKTQITNWETVQKRQEERA